MPLNAWKPNVMLAMGLPGLDALAANRPAQAPAGAEQALFAGFHETAEVFVAGVADAETDEAGRPLADLIRLDSEPADSIVPGQPAAPVPFAERQVLLQEFAEDDDDPVSAGYRLFDRACYGLHPVGQPVIGSRRNIERFQRDDLVRYVERQYTGTNLVVGAAGRIDPDAILRAVEASFGGLRAGTPNVVVAPVYAGAIRARAVAGSSQTHVVLGFPIPSLRDDDAASAVAATLFGEGMSSPLLDLLTVRYVMTEGEIPNPGYRLVYDGEVRIYRNEQALPRAEMAPEAYRAAGGPVDVMVRIEVDGIPLIFLFQESFESEADNKPGSDLD